MDLNPGLPLQEVLDSTIAYILAEKITQFDAYSFMASEIDLRSTVHLRDGSPITPYGRADCILSEMPFHRQFHRDNAQNHLLVIDLKTGATSQSDLIKLAKPTPHLPNSLTGLQLVLYGLILENIGYKFIKLLILNGDPYDQGEPIELRAITQSENFVFIENFLKKLLIDGTFGYGEKNPFLRSHFTPPIATIPPENAVIQEKRRKLFVDRDGLL
jgi:hypothetical protein